MEELNCGREEDLVGFLYGELDDAEKARFSRHIESCEGCKSQLVSFSHLRESVVAWRDESLGALPTSTHVQPVVAHQPNRSALAALREFFNLSPLWAKGTLAFASLLFCLLAVLAVARFSETAPANIVATDSNSPATKDINAEVERRVKQELEKRLANQPSTITPEAAMPSRENPMRSARVSKRIARSATIAKNERPLSKIERQELAADLRLTEDNTDLDLILIGDRINQ